MTSEEISALNELTQNNAITFKPADKEGATVVWDMVSYIIKARRQLADTNVYRTLDMDSK